MINKIRKAYRDIRNLKQDIKNVKLLIGNNHYSIEKQLAENKGVLNELNWSNIFNSATKGSSWFYDVPLNVGRWAGSYSFFYVLYRVLNDFKPMNVLEFGLGESSSMIQSYKKYYNINSNCISVEHSNEWIKKKLHSGLSNDYINIIQTSLKNVIIEGHSTLMYDKLLNKMKKLQLRFNLVVVDGPYGSSKFSRYNIIEIVEHNLLDDDFVILFDDVDREGEKSTLLVLEQLLKNKQIEYQISFYQGIKDQALIVSKNLNFLSSL